MRKVIPLEELQAKTWETAENEEFRHAFVCKFETEVHRIAMLIGSNDLDAYKAMWEVLLAVTEFEFRRTSNKDLQRYERSLPEDVEKFVTTFGGSWYLMLGKFQGIIVTPRVSLQFQVERM